MTRTTSFFTDNSLYALILHILPALEGSPSPHNDLVRLDNLYNLQSSSLAALIQSPAKVVHSLRDELLRESSKIKLREWSVGGLAQELDGKRWGSRGFVPVEWR